jgi:hypothetical protein
MWPRYSGAAGSAPDLEFKLTGHTVEQINEFRKNGRM